jgi:hypothetical protein
VAFPSGESRKSESRGFSHFWAAPRGAHFKPSAMIARYSARLIWLGLSLECLVLLAAGLESGGETRAFFQAAARLSGRVSLLFFALLLVYATLHPAFERGSDSLRVKERLFRDFAILHVIHWFLLAKSVYLSGFELVPTRVAGGALAYLLVVGMPLVIRGNWFKINVLARLQGFYLFWVWLIFFLTYVTRLRGQSPDASGAPSAWWPLAAATLGLMLWRIWKIAERRNPTRDNIDGQ